MRVGDAAGLAETDGRWCGIGQRRGQHAAIGATAGAVRWLEAGAAASTVIIARPQHAAPVDLLVADNRPDEHDRPEKVDDERQRDRDDFQAHERQISGGRDRRRAEGQPAGRAAASASWALTFNSAKTASAA
jgi:hypothetical protein